MTYSIYVLGDIVGRQIHIDDDSATTGFWFGV